MSGIAWYTGLRVALLAAVWLLIQVVTPLRGLMAIAVAIVISGVISFILLDRTRDRASVGLSGFFRRIDERIERSRTAEDVDDLPESGQGDAGGEQQAVAEGEETRGLQDGHESGPRGAADDGSDGTHRQDRSDEADRGKGQP